MKKKYSIPRALDLSSLGVVGYDPIGICHGGWDPSTTVCSSGSKVTQAPASCYPTGNQPAHGRCTSGSAATSNCIGLGSIN